uniref:Uncharacterized protein n=1 Tax=Oryza brachyantha TaxID=4533 RepID=J3N3Q0_ORYBR
MVMVAVVGRHIGADPVPGGGRLHDVGLPGAEGRRGWDDPVADREGIDGRAEGVDLAEPLVACDSAGEGRADRVDALNAIEVGGVNGGGQHPHAHITVANLHRRHVRHPDDLLATRGGRRGRPWRAGTSR